MGCSAIIIKESYMYTHKKYIRKLERKSTTFSFEVRIFEKCYVIIRQKSKKLNIPWGVAQ